VFYEATYQPSKPEDFNADTKKFIGRRIALQDGWKLEDGPNKGEYCYLPSHGFFVAFIPASELKDIQNISYGRWKELNSNLK
jgi:hypothetical protein